MATSDAARFELTAAVPEIETLVVGVSEYGLAGLTAVDYLVDQFPMEQVGHLVDAGPPNITPFEAGRPRHHTRLYVDEESSVAAVVGERFVPPAMSDEVAEAIETVARTLTAESVTVLSGVPVAHGPDDHVPFYIATDDYRAAYLADSEIRPMGSGFLEGLPAEIITHGISDESLACGVFTTPAHPQAPDAAAAVRLVGALSETQDIAVDTEPLEAFAASVESHYKALAERLEAAEPEAAPEDRMYM